MTIVETELQTLFRIGIELELEIREIEHAKFIEDLLHDSEKFRKECMDMIIWIEHMDEISWDEYRNRKP